MEGRSYLTILKRVDAVLGYEQFEHRDKDDRILIHIDGTIRVQ